MGEKGYMLRTYYVPCPVGKWGPFASVSSCVCFTSNILCISRVWGYSYCSQLTNEKCSERWWSLGQGHTAVLAPEATGPLSQATRCVWSHFWCCTHTAWWDQREGWAGEGQRQRQPWVHWGSGRGDQLSASLLAARPG